MLGLRFAFICNKNIDRNRLWRHGIHLTNEGMSLLSKNFLEHLNSFFHQNMDFSEKLCEQNLARLTTK